MSILRWVLRLDAHHLTSVEAGLNFQKKIRKLLQGRVSESVSATELINSCSAMEGQRKVGTQWLSVAALRFLASREMCQGGEQVTRFLLLLCCFMLFYCTFNLSFPFLKKITFNF